MQYLAILLKMALYLSIEFISNTFCSDVTIQIQNYNKTDKMLKYSSS